ncbi:DUF1850 domain-containing protein [Sulfitobacter aestuarii]|uniref:DUF1850 domain-containing protein n=1 Tax=Sulfitobacter aestuarii TaxID=2161676 RepID=A0ABW5U9Y3_9RHOB
MPASGALGALGMAILAILPLPARAADLCLGSHPDGESIARYALTDDNSFSLGFIHSVSRTPVRDLYVLRDGAILQTGEIFEAHGAGLPSLGNDLDATGFRHEEGRFILDLDRQIGEMIVRIQREFKNTLYIGSEIIPLAPLGRSALLISGCKTKE